jgi:pyruvate,water dikinase
MMWSHSQDRTESSASAEPIHQRYRILRRLLGANSELLELMADLEADLSHLEPGEPQIRQPIIQLLEGSLLLSENLNLLTNDRYKGLYDAHWVIEKAVREYLRSFQSPSGQQLLIPLHEANVDRIREVGGKAAHLGELRVTMPDLVPPGFVITTAAYRLLLEKNNLHQEIRRLLRDLSFITERELFRERTAAIRALFQTSPVPRILAEAIADGIMQFPLPWPSLWAVRSSCVGEDGPMSFAGQFDSFLNVAKNELQDAYKKVVASRYTDRAVLYRLACGFTEVNTPMAVLFLPMQDAHSAGVLYTRDPRDESADRMMVSSVRGLAEDMVRGLRQADIFLVQRSRPGVVLEKHLAAISSVLTSSSLQEKEAKTGPSAPSSDASSLAGEELQRLVEIGLRVEKHFGRPQDIEWVLTPERRIMIVQSRPLRVEDRRVHEGQAVETRKPLLEGGITIFPGRAVGPAYVARTAEDLSKVPEGAILVMDQANPEVAAVLPMLAGLVSEHGNPGDHAATLTREFGIPGLFSMKGAMNAIQHGQALSLDATRRRVFEGTLWPEVRDRMKAKIRQIRSGEKQNLLHERILALNMLDPLSRSFRADKCQSVHDIIRFSHEMAIAAMFDLGDRAVKQGRQRAFHLESEVPLNLVVLDLGSAFPEGLEKRKAIKPDEILSTPFQALWQGIRHPGISWAGRRHVSMSGFTSVITASVTDGQNAIRRLGDSNYLIVTPEYLNMNARLAYHFAMLDAFVSDVPQNNFVNFRFRGGGAGPARRDLRAQFLTDVLVRSNFGVNRRGDLVTSWLRGHSKDESEAALVMLGKLMGCARQLDMLMENEAAVNHFVERFFAEDYQAFA